MVYDTLSNGENFNFNKYLINPTVQLYTRYVYYEYKDSGKTHIDLSAVEWKNDRDNSYQLINENGNINSGRTTYFVESVKVTLGGGKNLHWTDGKGFGEGIKSGNINIVD